MSSEEQNNLIHPNQVSAENRPTATQPVDFKEAVMTDEWSDDHKPKRSVAEEFRIFLGAVFSWIVIPLLIVVIIHNFFFQAYHVVGSSMQPNLHETDYLIISKLGKTGSDIQRTFGAVASYIPARGKVIVFHFPQNPAEIFVKRVIGLPGDRVVIKDGKMTVYNEANPNGFNPDVKYEAADTVTLEDTDVTVHDGNVFVVGDNRGSGESYDSRAWGELPSSYIIGDAVFRLLPIDQLKAL